MKRTLFNICSCLHFSSDLSLYTVIFISTCYTCNIHRSNLSTRIVIENSVFSSLYRHLPVQINNKLTTFNCYLLTVIVRYSIFLRNTSWTFLTTNNQVEKNHQPVTFQYKKFHSLFFTHFSLNSLQYQQYYLQLKIWSHLCTNNFFLFAGM